MSEKWTEVVKKIEKIAIFHDFFAFSEKMPRWISLIFGMELDINKGYQLPQTRFSWLLLFMNYWTQKEPKSGRKWNQLNFNLNLGNFPLGMVKNRDQHPDAG